MSEWWWFSSGCVCVVLLRMLPQGGYGGIGRSEQNKERAGGSYCTAARYANDDQRWIEETGRKIS